MSIFQGCCTAIITPFSNDGRKINYTIFKNLIDMQIENGINAIVFMGTTGESATMSYEEKLELGKFAVEYVNKRVPVVLGSGSNNTEIAIQLSIEFEKLGADGLLVVTPYYNKCSQEGAIEHYTKIADAVNIPIILYNVPSRTGFNLLPTTVKILSKHKNIVAIKEANGNMSQILELFNIIDSDFDIYSGDDALYFNFLTLGGSGVISVASNIIPKRMTDIFIQFKKGKIKNAKGIQLKLIPFINSLFFDVNPIPIKTLMNFENMDVGKVRLPLTHMNEQKKALLISEYEKIKDYLK